MVKENGRRDYEGLATLVPEIRVLTRQALGARGFSGADILESWEDIVGPDLAKGVKPEKLTFEGNSRSKGTLVVKTAGGAFAMLFEHQKRRVIERVNAFFGYPAVSHIKMIQGSLKLSMPKLETKRPIDPKKLKELTDKVALIEDEDLRERTYAVGEAMLKKK
ncbi:MAG: DUF721 domain-containing protein [Alphaproteobacteria bacterium]|nr:DUF721 domain-containing protein [Alphaproteobacteria bacterium]MBR6675564.1 DUF721 domain-containing protein [Alphaproteobacteria bacterium]